MDRKYFYYLDRKMDLNIALEDYLDMCAEFGLFKFMYIVSKESLLKDDFKKRASAFIEEANRAGVWPQDIVIAGESGYSFSPRQWEKVKELNQYFALRGVAFGFEDKDKTWDIASVEVANTKIAETANAIKCKKLSPLEELLDCYISVISRRYNDVDTGAEHGSFSRSVYGVLNSDRVVCVGYAELAKAIMQEVGDENVKLYINDVSLSDDGKTLDAYHSNLIVYIKDEKYGLNGYYMLDPTQDSYEEDEPCYSLASFLVPLKDIDNIEFKICSFESDLKESEELADRLDSQPEDERINKDEEFNISFSCEEYIYTISFLKDLYNKKPEIKNKLIEEINNKEILNILEEIENIDKKINNFNYIEELLKELNINYVTKENYNLFIDKLDNLNIDEITNVLCEISKQEINSNNNYPLVNIVEREKQNLEFEKQTHNKQIEKIYNITEEQFIQLVIKTPEDLLKNYLIEESNPIDASLIYRALYNVVKTSNAKLTEQTWHKCCKNILEYTCEVALKLYTEDAVNSYYVYGKNHNLNERF